MNHSMVSSGAAVMGIEKPHWMSLPTYLSLLGTLSEDSPSRVVLLMGHEVMAIRRSGLCVSAHATPEYLTHH